VSYEYLCIAVRQARIQHWCSLHRRVEGGGWSRQVNVHDFPRSKDIAGVNMRLTAGGVRELHWHESDEWSLMLYGNAHYSAQF
jgi:oxalate decarboxylase